MKTGFVVKLNRSFQENKRKLTLFQTGRFLKVVQINLLLWCDVFSSEFCDLWVVKIGRGKGVTGRGKGKRCQVREIFYFPGLESVGERDSSPDRLSIEGTPSLLFSSFIFHFTKTNFLERLNLNPFHHQDQIPTLKVYENCPTKLSSLLTVYAEYGTTSTR